MHSNCCFFHFAVYRWNRLLGTETDLYLRFTGVLFPLRILMQSSTWVSCFFISWTKVSSFLPQCFVAAELHGVLLALFPGVAINNAKNSKPQRRPKETQVILRIWSKPNLTVVNCVTDWWNSGCDSSLVQQGDCVNEFGARHFSCFPSVGQSFVQYWQIHKMMTAYQGIVLKRGLSLQFFFCWQNTRNTMFDKTLYQGVLFAWLSQFFLSKTLFFLLF